MHCSPWINSSPRHHAAIAPISKGVPFKLDATVACGEYCGSQRSALGEDCFCGHRCCYELIALVVYDTCMHRFIISTTNSSSVRPHLKKMLDKSIQEGERIALTKQINMGIFP